MRGIAVPSYDLYSSCLRAPVLCLSTEGVWAAKRWEDTEHVGKWDVEEVAVEGAQSKRATVVGGPDYCWRDIGIDVGLEATMDAIVWGHRGSWSEKGGYLPYRSR